ncbi:MAG: tRNA pseudouridine(38-40) synthase TruA [Lachnospiraceae bacterium]|nr:tRNA pseudouridine(38-40) synthase TruA [Lachnospiraceae bacterium]
MRNIQLTIEYDGSRYDGWQKQPGSKSAVTIQDKIEDVLSKMEGETVEVVGAARTEAGVHAYHQIANFKTDSDMKVYEIKHYLNRFLPRDIAVVEALEVPERFHASFNAKSFVYEYKISIGEVPSVFDRKYNYYCFKRPDVAKMKEAAKALIGTHDFKAFSDNKRMKKSTIREIYSLDVYGDDKEVLITVHGDDFWPHMVRIIVGTLLQAGLGEIEPEDMAKILESKDREKAGPTAEAKGLFLSEVMYI